MIDQVVILYGAEQDLLTGFFRYDNHGRGLEFYKAVDEKLDLLRHFPEAGSIYHKNFRRILLKKRFSYGIYYRIHGNRLIINAILYLKISPGKILERLKGL